MVTSEGCLRLQPLSWSENSASARSWAVTGFSSGLHGRGRLAIWSLEALVLDGGNECGLLKRGEPRPSPARLLRTPARRSAAGLGRECAIRRQRGQDWRGILVCLPWRKRLRTLDFPRSGFAREVESICSVGLGRVSPDRDDIGRLSIHEHVSSAQEPLLSKVVEPIGAKRRQKDLIQRKSIHISTLDL
jgi:hypothetical protein